MNNTAGTDARYDWLTVSALSVIAMCVVTIAHEVLGHGTACLIAGGRSVDLTSSVFRCDVRAPWIAPAGPLGNLACGTVAVLWTRHLPRRAGHLRLFLILVAGFAFFWESGYVIVAMLTRDGDGYFGMRDLLGAPDDAWRTAGVGIGCAAYSLAARWVSRTCAALFTGAATTRRVLRTAWLAAACGAVIAAAFAVPAEGWTPVRMAALEVGAATWPLLLSPRGGALQAEPSAGITITRVPAIVATAGLVFAIFAATLGRGLHF